MVPLTLNAAGFDVFLREQFPLLGEAPYDLCRMDKHRRLHVLNYSIKTPNAIKAMGELGRSSLYIRPKRDKEITISDESDELSEGSDIETSSVESLDSENMERTNNSPLHASSSVTELSQMGVIHSETCPFPSENTPPVLNVTQSLDGANTHIQLSPTYSPLSELSPIPSHLGEDSPAHLPASERSPVHSHPTEVSLVDLLAPVRSPVYFHLSEDSPGHLPASERSPVRPRIHQESLDIVPVPDANSATDIGDIIKRLQGQILREPPRANIINVYREDVLDCTLRAFQRQRFNAEARVDVAFVDVDGKGEGSVDEGGPRREFLRLLMQEVQHCRIFEGPEESRSLALHGDAVQKGLYRTIGKMISMAVVQGGLPINFFSERLYCQISASPPPKYTLEEVTDLDICSQMEKINTAKSVEEAREAISCFADTLGVMGALTYVRSLEDRDRVIEIALQFYLQDRLSQALSQLKEGLMTLGLLDEIVANPAVFHQVFTRSAVPLTSTDIANLFEPIFSPAGSNRRRSENRTLAFWRDWLLEVEEENVDNVKLEDVLIFASGASKIPLSGFNEKPTITFTEPGLGRNLPTANTCSVTLNLPMCPTFKDFSGEMAFGIACAKTFGTA
ncbi:G2/M phase-specific E3 ubiquitin-protein ligase-like [Misgurnus anguillicaudatus]|uniref:G2/M phase-specific E3 ubiquitin-protein ligase-like n=1 Tax=Misgurnus anguillicaudatus TaxID=75329 RepID=UPI003CCF0462